MRNHPLAAIAALIALGVLPALSGCSSSSGDRAGGDRAAGHSSASSPASGGPSAGAGASSPGPVLPDSEIEAPKGSGKFTKKEKEYLSGRVPERMEPAAVLDLGKEACQRIDRTARHDKDAVIGALVAGEIPDAEPAVTHLCPEHEPLLEAAKGGYPDGQHPKPAAGRYRTVSAGPACAWTVTGSGGKVLASGPGTGGARKDGTYTMTVPSGAARLVSSGCYAWVRA
ncbi:hypothetical protein [Streptomyces fragilis]|uniref:DUF732 domain-containing protein n=1 Tax=Streptomyces fragilis TaxID=67301 RepID=A0ABV2YFJ4_9ACTN|nr:hypothetical protein [Streptomyces fragilis]